MEQNRVKLLSLTLPFFPHLDKWQLITVAQIKKVWVLVLPCSSEGLYWGATQPERIDYSSVLCPVLSPRDKRKQQSVMYKEKLRKGNFFSLQKRRLRERFNSCPAFHCITVENMEQLLRGGE